MSEWWTYSLHDFLLFSPRTYHRLIELHNIQWWPAQIVAMLAGLGVAALLLHRAPRTAPLAALVLAVAWAWVGTTFLWLRYATINWAATYLALAFATEAVLLVASAWRARTDRFRPAMRVTATSGARWRIDRVAGWLMLVAALGYGGIALVSARGIRAAEVVGITADPTVLATLGVLLIAPLPWRPALLPIPLLWCVVSGATQWAMGTPEALLLPAGGLVTLAAMASAGRHASDGT
jgi:hypothetical protein